MVAEQDIDDDGAHYHMLKDKLQHHEQQPADCCVICLEAVSDPCEAAPCGHYHFDYLCASSWLFLHPSCPLCKATVTSILHGAPGTPNRPSTAIPRAAPTPAQAAARYYSNSRGGGSPRTTEQRQRQHGNDHSQARRRMRRPGMNLDTRRSGNGTGGGSDIQTRRQVYADGRFCMHVGSNRVSQYRELTPQLFCSDENLVSRARMFIRRELQVFSFLSGTAEDDDDDDNNNNNNNNGSGLVERNDDNNTSSAPVAQQQQRRLRRANNAEFLLEYVVAILKSVDIMGSGGAARDMLSDFLGGDHARLFLHELRAWLRSPYARLEDWDRTVQYGPGVSLSLPRRRQEEEGSKMSGGNSSNSRPRDMGDYYRPGGGNSSSWTRSSRCSVRRERFRRTAAARDEGRWQRQPEQ